MLTLGIESSCDETAVAVVELSENQPGSVAQAQALSNIILSQREHTRFGGVVPEIASRAHVRAIAPIYLEALEKARVTLDDIDLIAATAGPGLVGCLLVGLNFAKGLALASGKDFVAVNHLEGHIAANYLANPELQGRHLTLVISGGHTLLVDVLAFGSYKIIGRTRDDAVGEAFDKVAKLLGLGYPGGQKIDELSRSGNREAIRFPRPMEKAAGYDFSYSGLKTAVALHWKSLKVAEQESSLADVAASFQEAAVEILVSKTLKAARELGVEAVSLSGGVAANRRLRELLALGLAEEGLDFHYPPSDWCTDNAAMIACAGALRFRLQGPSTLDVDASPAWPLPEQSD